jgi:iron(III) transport system permease protein
MTATSPALPPSQPTRWMATRDGLTSSRWFPYLLAVPVVAVLAGYVVGPLLATFAETRHGAGLLANYGRFFTTDGVGLSSLLTTIAISLASVVLCGLVGTSMAFLLSRYEFPGRRLIEALILIPAALPSLIGAVSFQMLYSNIGIVPRWLQQVLGTDKPVLAATGIAGVLVVHTFTMYPFFYLSVTAALAGLDTAVEEAATNLGSSPARVLRTVTLPMLTPALVSGSLIVFMVSMASYTAPLLFNVSQTMTMQIVINRTNGNLPVSATYATVLAIISIAFLLGMRWYEGRRGYRSVSKGVATTRREARSPWTRAAALLASIVATLILLAPVATIALVAFSARGSWTTQIIPARYTLDNFVTIFTDPRALRPILNSLEMSALATAASIVMGLLSAYLVRRFQFVGRGLIDVAVMLPWALPGTVVAVNLISAFSQGNAFSFGQVLVGSFWILPLAYFVRFLPLVFRSSSAALSQLDPALEEVARNLGASWWRSFRTVTVKLVYRGVLAGALLAFVDGVGEFVASILIYTKKTSPISIEINNRLYAFDMGTAAAYGMLQVVLIFAVMLVSRRLEALGAGRDPQHTSAQPAVTLGGPS